MMPAPRPVSGRELTHAADHAKSEGVLAPARALRSTTTDDLQSYLAGTGTTEASWLGPAQQHEEAWFLGLRTNAGVDVAALREEFGEELIAPALETVRRLAEDGLLIFDGVRARLTARGRLISNDIFQELLDLAAETARP